MFWWEQEPICGSRSKGSVRIRSTAFGSVVELRESFKMKDGNGNWHSVCVLRKWGSDISSLGDLAQL